MVRRTCNKTRRQFVLDSRYNGLQFLYPYISQINNGNTTRSAMSWN